MHENSPLDVWYHDTLMAASTMQAYLNYAIASFEDRGMGQDETVMMLRKATKKFPVVKMGLLEKYLELKNGKNEAT